MKAAVAELSQLMGRRSTILTLTKTPRGRRDPQHFSESKHYFGSELLMRFCPLQERFQLQWGSRGSCAGSERHGDQHSEDKHSQNQQHPGVQYEQSTPCLATNAISTECNNFRSNLVNLGEEPRIKFSEMPLQLRII